MIEKQEFLMGIRGIIRLYESMLKAIEDSYGLSLLEANIVSFLYNNPEKNTAADIVEYRMISKGNVSKGVESLIQKKLLRRIEDVRDRRRVNLFLQPEAKPITEAIERIRRDFFGCIFADISEAEQDRFFLLNKKIVKNTKDALAKR